MIFDTKFNLGDTVYIITKNTTYKKKVCNTCDGMKYVVIKGKKFICPDCNGYERTEEDGSEWSVTVSGEIGQIAVEVRSKKYRNNNKKKSTTEYMIDSTGVGSGTVHYECDLFGSLEEATKECERRNNENL